MKTINLRLGKRGGPFVRVPISEPETPAEFLGLHGQNDKFLTKCANRGRRILIQEAGRDAVLELSKAGKSEAEIVEAVIKLLSGVDLTAKKERGPGKASTPKEVKLTGGKKSYTAEELQAILAAQGVVLTVEAPAATPAK